MTTAQENAWLDQEESHLAQVVRAHRWAAQYVAAGEELHEPPFGCTIGMHGMVHPELVVVGLGSVESRALLQRPATMVVAGRDLVPGEQLSLPERDLTVEHLPNPGEVVLGANPVVPTPGGAVGRGLPADLGARRRVPVGPALPVQPGCLSAPPRHLASPMPAWGG